MRTLLQLDDTSLLFSNRLQQVGVSVTVSMNPMNDKRSALFVLTCRSKSRP